MSLKDKTILIPILFLILTFLVWQVPFGRYILYPFTILGTWFHEMGHGLTAIALGADFIKLEIYSNGSGLAQHTTDVFFGNLGLALVAAGGPVGPPIAGSFFLIFSTNSKTSRWLLLGFSLFMILSVIIWVRSWFGVGIILLFSGVILLIALRGNEKAQVITMQLIGIQAFFSLYQSFGYLMSSGAVVDGTSYMSDTGKIAENLFLPNWLWAGLIILFSIIIFYKSLSIISKK